MLQSGHYLLLIIILIIIGWGFNKAALNAGYSDEKRARFNRGYVLVMTAWIIYSSALAATGFLQDFSLPPRLPLFIVLPAFGIIALFFTRKKFIPVIAAFPIALTVYYQSFRIVVELLIWGLYQKGIGPELVTFEGRNFDILAGLSAPIVGYLAYNRKVISHKVVIAWNICCLLLLANIVFIFISLIVLPSFWGYEVTPVSAEFPTVPYIFIASAFMPTAVFMHVFSIKKSLQAIKQNASR